MVEKDKNYIEKIKEKFSKIFKEGESRPRNLVELDKIYETIKDSKNSLRINEISEITKIKASSVRIYIKKYLEKKNYVKKSRLYTPPYLMIEHYEGSPEFIYGKDKRDQRIEDEKKNLESNSRGLDKSHKEKVKILLQKRMYDSPFFKLWNELIEFMWNNRIYSVNKMRIGSGANRYKI